MNISIYLRHALIMALVIASTNLYAQIDSEKIKAKWIIEKFEIEKNIPSAAKAQQELQGVYLAFGNDELLIWKRTNSTDSLIKKGPYSISGNFLTLGKDQGEILELSEKHLKIKLPRQGVLYLIKM